jgi:hypothetical protein
VVLHAGEPSCLQQRWTDEPRVNLGLPTDAMIDSRARHRTVSLLIRWAPPILVAAAFVHGVTSAGSNGEKGNLANVCWRVKSFTPTALLRPAVPYVNMLLYRPRRYWRNLVGDPVGALMCLGLYRLSRSFLGPWPSATVAASFVYLCAFAHLNSSPIFNFVLPYSYASTYGIVAATWSVHWLVLHIRRKVSAHFLLSVACLVLAAFTKLEILLAASAAHAAFLVFALIGRQLSPKLYLSAYVAAALVVGICGSLAAQVGPALWHDNRSRTPPSGNFSLIVMGLHYAATLPLSWHCRRSRSGPSSSIRVLMLGCAGRKADHTVCSPAAPPRFLRPRYRTSFIVWGDCRSRGVLAAPSSARNGMPIVL